MGFSVFHGLSSIVGIGVIKDEKKAFHYYEQATNQGLIQAQSGLAFCYQKGIGVQKDEILALKNYEIVAEKGYSDAQNSLGTFFSTLSFQPRKTKNRAKLPLVATKTDFRFSC